MSEYDQTITKALRKYKAPDVAKSDVRTLMSTFKDLLPRNDEYVFNDGTKKYLLQLEGTIPVYYRETTYNIPISVWLKDEHLYKAPMVHVRPTSTMGIVPSAIVDRNGKIDVPYLREWRYPNSDLYGLIQVLTILFGEEPPVASRVPQSTLTPGFEQVFTRGLTKYTYPDVVSKDVFKLFTMFKDLHPYTYDCVLADRSTKQLLNLEGTIPITHKGSTYNIPIVIRLMDRHPYVPPSVYVRPSATMVINQKSDVDLMGKVDIPFLREWKYPQSDLVGLVQVLTIMFSEKSPVYNRPAHGNPNVYPHAAYPYYPTSVGHQQSQNYLPFQDQTVGVPYPRQPSGLPYQGYPVDISYQSYQHTADSSGMIRSNSASPYMANTENQHKHEQQNPSIQADHPSTGVVRQINVQAPTADSGARNMPGPQNLSHGTGAISSEVIPPVNIQPSAPPDDNASDDLFLEVCRDISKLRMENCNPCLRKPVPKTNLGNWVCKDCEDVLCEECQITHDVLGPTRNHTILNFNPKCGPCEAVNKKQIGIWHCTECSKYLCDQCKSHHKLQSQWKSHNIVKSTEAVRRLIQEHFSL